MAFSGRNLLSEMALSFGISGLKMQKKKTTCVVHFCTRRCSNQNENLNFRVHNGHQTVFEEFLNKHSIINIQFNFLSFVFHFFLNGLVNYSVTYLLNLMRS